VLGWPIVGMSWSLTCYKFFLYGFSSYKLKRNGLSLGDLNFLKVTIFCYKCQIVVGVLVIANFHKEKSRLPPINHKSNFN